MINPRHIWAALGGETRRARYERWVYDHSAELYCFAFRLCGNADTAEDLVQETFFHAWKGIDKLRRHDKARAWLFQMLRHRHAHWLRAQSRRPTVVESLDGQMAHAEASGAAPLQVLADRESLQVALDKLEQRFKLPLLMVLLEGLTCREAADRLDLPVGTVLSRIYRARRHLRGALADETDSLKASVESPERPPALAPRLRLGGEA
ncbi:MAG: sigma-70 family RNA polymerase sigma factor [Planctomycetes bacterium]|nr:sigma-70 family RNA polymerase sigma factor [Planctomycetota bacterium]